MIVIILTIFIVVTIMILLMFIMLKRIIKILNDRSKSYFINKLQDYDNLIELKSKQLENINRSVKNSDNLKTEEKEIRQDASSDIYYEFEIPKYKDEVVFKHYKTINEKFNINNKNIVINFINEKMNFNSEIAYNRLKKFNDKLNFEVVYKLMLLERKKQISLLKNIADESEKKYIDKYSEEKFNIIDFKNYIEDLLQKNDPTIYIKVGKVDENYDHLNSCIKTIYDEKICKGIIIIYKNKLYDYSLS